MIISLIIAGILLSAVFRFFTNIVKYEKKISLHKEDIIKKNYLEIKLNNIFSKIDMDNEKSFYTKNNKLFFSFDNNIDIDPKYSSKVFGCIYTEKNNLILKISPLDNPAISRKIILLKEVEKVSFEFQKKYFKNNNYIIKKSLNWTKDFPEITIIKLKKTNNEHLKLNFFLPSKKPIVTYID